MCRHVQLCSLAAALALFFGQAHEADAGPAPKPSKKVVAKKPGSQPTTSKPGVFRPGRHSALSAIARKLIASAPQGSGAPAVAPIKLPVCKGCSLPTPPPGAEPTPFVRLRGVPQGALARTRIRIKAPAAAGAGRANLARLISALDRDGWAAQSRNGMSTAYNAAEGVPAPVDFCVRGACGLPSYQAVAARIYGAAAGGAMPVFCAPKATAGGWSKSQVHCSSNWLETLGSVSPWKGDDINPEYQIENVPPFACFGAPQLTTNHILVPNNNRAGSDKSFYCRNRIFHIQVKKPERDRDDQLSNIKANCATLRAQYWPSIPTANGPLVEGPARARTPYVPLSREELLVFFGHRELYCRANRGPTHRDRNTSWATSFLCDVSRGLLESGPMEEGVQACAIAPFVPSPKSLAPVDKARLHCWQFNRPTCEELSDPEKENIYRSGVFEYYDTLRQVRRTRDPKAWTLRLDKADELPTWQERYAFPDAAKDEGTFGVKKFCRFVGDMKTIQCGYTQQTMAQWYELRQGEEPVGCASGVCARGAYQRGYYCALLSSPELFKGEPHWMCGIDPAKAAQQLKGSKELCVGGAAITRFRPPSGAAGSSLQCFERNYRWGEWATSTAALKGIHWRKIIADLILAVPELDPLLSGSLKAVSDKLRLDVAELSSWAGSFGHALGHLRTLRMGLLKSKVPVIGELKKKTFGNDDAGKTLGALFDEVRSGGRPPDGRWYVEVRDAAKSADGTSRTDDLALAFRLHHVFAALHLARDVLAERARDYFNKVRIVATNNQTPYQTRVEILERTRAVNPKMLKTPNGEVIQDLSGVFCVARDSTSAGARDFLCGSSPLLALGAVESRVMELVGTTTYYEGMKPTKTDAANLWWNPIKAAQSGWILSAQEITASTRNKVSFPWCYGAADQGALVPFQLAPVLLAPGAESPYAMDVPAAAATRDQKKSVSDWLRCDRFRFADETWQEYNASALFKPKATPGQPTPASGSQEGTRIVEQIGSLLKLIVDLALPNLSDVLARVKDLSNMPGDFFDYWMGQLKGLQKGLWDGHKSEIQALQSAIETATTAWANAQGDAKGTALTALQGAKQALTDYISQKVNPGSQTIPGSGGVLVGMLDDLSNRVAERVISLIEPRAREILSKGFELVREVLDPIAAEVIGLVASIPFIGSALATAAQILYSWAMTRLEALAFEKLMGVVERLVAKGLRAVMGPVLEVAKNKVLELLYSSCNLLFPMACPKDGKFFFAALPKEHQWLERALACSGRPILGPEVHQRALAARETLRRTGQQMRSEVAAYGRDIANRMLARHGHTYESWMAATKREPPHVLRAIANRLQREMKAAVAQKHAR
jgi:hypothetical protein